MDLFLIRGLPGSGKSTLAYSLCGMFVFEADDFFVHDGVYNFDPSLLPQAHADCQRRTRDSLEHGFGCAVANTFSQRWEMQPYIEMAQELGARVTVVSVFDGGCSNVELAERNTHGVPIEAIAAMRTHWEHDWRNGKLERPTRPSRFNA